MHWAEREWVMFKDLRTSTKLLVLCGTFMASVLVPVYALVAEKQLAIDIARKELSGSRYLATIRTTYAAVLALDRSPASDGAIERELAAAETRSAGQFQTSGLSQALAATVRELGGARATSAGSDPRLAQVL